MHSAPNREPSATNGTELIAPKDGATLGTDRAAAFWIAVAAGLIVTLVILRAVLLPFVAGMVLAYLLNPIVTWLERQGMNRLVATLTIVGLFFGCGALTLILMAPVIVSEVADFVDSAPRYIAQLQAVASDPDRPWLSKLVGEGLGHAHQSLAELTSWASGGLETVLHSVWSGGEALLSGFSLAVVAPVVACYFIYDWNKMKAVVDKWVPPARRDTVRTLAREIDDTIGGFVIGQGILCVILATFYAVALSVIGLKHAVLIGVATGLISFVPYLGSITGLIVSSCVAVAQFRPNWTPILIVPAIFLVGQTIADYALSPYFVGRRVNLHPVWVMFALFAFGYLFGFFGLLIAVPLAAAIGVLARFAFRNYYASRLYAAIPTTPKG